ncbi:hypothetical protein [Fulvivirga sediminis]|uniref:Uncharacterized protein n=1 Tax=Fulvivirga sediminis TaxID=2803949 RepID=A0A937FCJ5_9BACT|nr:hypothetical protein [Fulvivirga sediminis]MBL3658048.1 hypothetical protein [Fulvivirga sediminis]
MLQNNYSYSYVVRGADLFDSNSESYTFFKVMDNVIVERKHYSYSMYGSGYETKCYPSKENCEYLKRIEEIRKSDSEKAKEALKNHLEEHYTPIFKKNFYNCWEEYEEFVGAHKRFGSAPRTIDDLYHDCRSYQAESEKNNDYIFEYKVSEDGVLCECYLKNELLMDAQVLKGVSILSVDF